LPGLSFWLLGIDDWEFPLKMLRMTGTSLFQNKWFRRLVGLVMGVLLLWALAWAAVPYILKSQLQSRASEALGRKVTVGQVDFKPWTLELEVKELQVGKASGTEPQLLIKRIYIDAALQSVFRLAPVVDRVAVDGLDLKLTHFGEGKYDIDDVIAKLNKPPDKPEPPSEPFKFALFNLALTQAQVDFSDKTVGKTHELRDLTLSVPFLSNLDSSRDVKTEPRLAFKFNGSSFDSKAQTTPFAQTHQTDATVRITGLNLQPYLGYLPAALPVRLLAAVLDADVRVAFSQTNRASVRLSGQVGARGVKVADARKDDLLDFDALKVTLDDVRPLEQSVKLGAVELTAAKLKMRRNAQGGLNLLFAPEKPVTTKTIAKEQANTGAIVPNPSQSKGLNAKAADKAPMSPRANPWKIEIAKVNLRDTLVGWTDDTTAPAARLNLQALNVEATDIALPFAKPLQFKGSAELTPATKSTPAPAKTAVATLSFSGSATDQEANVDAALDGALLAWGGPYVAQFLEPSLAGTLNTALNVLWKPEGLKLNVKTLALNNLALSAAGQPKPAAKTSATTASATLASIKRLEVTDAQIDLARQTVSIGRLQMSQPAADVVRGSDKRWMFERWIKNTSAPAKASSATVLTPAQTARMAAQAASAGLASAQGESTASAPAANTGKPTATASAWAVTLADIALDGGTVNFLDKAPATPVQFQVSAIKVQLKSFALDAKKPSPLTLSARITAPQNEPGQVDYKGLLGLTPLTTQGSLVATQIPVHAFEPYFADALNIELLRAQFGFKGDIRFAGTPAGPVVKANGDTVVEDFRANSVRVAEPAPSAASAPVAGAASAVATSDLKISEELLSWKALGLRGVDVAVAPGTATTIAVRETALSDFFARILISDTGRINLQDVLKSSAPSAIADTAKSVANNQAKTGAIVPSDTQKPVATGLDPIINIGPVSLINGKVFFSDKFVRPNYSANLSELTGQLSAFSSVPGSAAAGAPATGSASAPATAEAPASAFQMADLLLKGRAEGTASLEITGKLNPLAKPLALDIKGKVRDLELAPLSPYSIKYAGHGIERGKLSVDVAYLVLPSGQLTASNNIILNQLTFGEKVEGAPNSLPVKLAVALLADRNGVIDINLPISGSLNDPQFSLGPIIFKVIVNLIVKAITSPFSLLASAFGGGGDELSQVAFAPGSAALSAEAKLGLDKVAKALTDRPALKMTVIGSASLDAERDAYRQARLKALLLAEKRRAAVVSGTPAQAAQVAEVTATETPALLKEVYKRADMPKPRNLIGLAKDIPGPEMEALLLTHIAVTDDVMRELAQARGVAVKEYLVDKQLPVERLFLGAAKPVAPDPKWTPRAELNLATN
jgi:hypothetical protein